ncbi:SF3a splicing factor complex subunit [Onygenales sp. PD_40]|nr:SF3a splicing factor complex subunit [Onygenales sp. PD_40]KAK2773220.1 SF3a splicing factor complex subunit [Onygenales sp. PD_12]KAK2790850.1 SF3a splicing factor complex subunit [Emmonsiellopsis sp. PD_33]KAK2804603.1 SF3a splicing factor complex subunit [Onygenales sp. PD_10]
MAPPSSNGTVATPADLPDEVSKPPEGIVLPPKDIRTIIEKTAGFVARNGHVFEDRVREKERTNPKFSFLSPNDAYAPFYSWRLSEIKAGRGTAVSAGRAGEPVAAPEPEKPKGPAQPPEFHYSARMPNINALDLEVVKLTALFVAKRGKSFMTALSQRETRNFQFDFLRPQHSLYQFFTRLVDQYTSLLQQDDTDGPNSKANRLAELEKNVKNKYHILDRAKQRAEWVKYQEQQKQKKEEQDEQEKIAYAQIDWHDFVVVETVLFTEADDQAELPPPTSLNDLQSASLEQKAMMSLQPHDRRIEEAMPTEEETTYYNAYPQVPTPQPQFPAAVPSPAPFQQPSPFTPHSPTPISTPPPPMPVPVASEEEERIRERTEARERAQAAQAAARAVPTPPPGGAQPMRIRSDYVPRAQAKRLNTTAAPTTLCPNCRQQIPIAELDHHMRVELLDPRWKEQRAKAEARYATTNLSTADVFNNLKRLASQRTDVFDPVLNASENAATAAAAGTGGADGVEGQGQGQLDPEEEARRKRAATGMGIAGMAGPPGYEMLAPGQEAAAQGPQMAGHPPPGGPPPPGQSVNIEEQIRHIHQKFKQ